MASNILTIEAAQQANINLVEGHKGRPVLHQMLVAYRNNRRQGTACTKTRADVQGSGKKLWNQKGTGRARMGSVRSPIFRGGGVVWGPKPRDYSQKMPKKMKQLALRTALTDRIRCGDVITTVKISIADGKTKTFISTISGLTDATKVLVVGGRFDELTFRAARNVAKVSLMAASDVNAEHLLNCEKIILTAEALETLAQRTAKIV
jgi:large subunit ribosomal protein L4